MKNRIYTLILSICLIAFLATSCNGKKDEPQVSTRRTILMYLVATNNLSSSIASDIREVENTIQSTDMNHCRMLVYITSTNQDPILYEIKKGKRGTENSTLKTYSTDIKSTTVERMQEVIKDAIEVAPADEYGLILGSHASGWASSLSARSSTSLLDFGDDNGSTMPIHELAEAIPDNTFKFIYNDACYMAGIEVAYELKNKTEYFIGSTTELPIDGMDYTNNIPCFFADNVDLKKVCNNTFNKYNQLSGDKRTCTISLIDCSQLNKLALITNEIFYLGTGTTEYYNLQKYKRNNPFLFYDFKQYINTFSAKNNENISKINTLIESFNKQLDKVVLYKAATPFIFGKDYLVINSENYSGLSTYIIGSSTSTGVNETYYKTLSWYRDVIQ